MNRFIRFYNQNRKSIWIIVGIIIAIILIMQMLNYSYKKKNSINNIENNIDNNTTRYNSLSLEGNKSIITGESISEKSEKSVKKIDEFFSYCNDQKIEEAYNLLTDDCKNEMYPSIENFKESYYNVVFNSQNKKISIENWINNIYKVEINDDYLSSGKYSKENTMQDYITLVKQNDEYKLNINKYIGKTVLDNEKQTEYMDIKVAEKHLYMDYVVYKFEITNKTEAKILLDSLRNIDTMYIKDSKDMKYSSYTNELTTAELLINSKEKKQVEIKYYSKYSSSKNIEKIGFSKIILDYEQYKSNEKYYGDYYVLEI